MVIDNARYHLKITGESKRPTTSWRKDVIQKWLTEKEIHLQKKDTKLILLEKLELIPIVKKYKLEEETAEYSSKSAKGIELLRLPVGQSEMNPIELIWVQIKFEVGQKNVTFKISDIKNIVDKAIKNFTEQKWMKAEQHVKKVEEEFWKVDFGQEDVDARRFIIPLTETDDENSDSDDDDNDDNDSEAEE